MVAVETAEQTLYCRGTDGGRPVTILPDGYRLGTRTYRSKRQLLIAVTGHPKARNWTFDRYFRQGRFSKPRKVVPTIDLLEFFAEEATAY